MMASGFKDVRAVEETLFPVEFLANDPTAKAIIDKLNLPSEEVKEVASSVASVKIYGIKPSDTNWR